MRGYCFRRQRVYFFLSITFKHLPFTYTGIHPAILAVCNGTKANIFNWWSFHDLLFLRLYLSHKPTSTFSASNVCVFNYFIAHHIPYMLHKIRKCVNLFCYRYSVSYLCICVFILNGNFLICCGQILSTILKCVLLCAIHLLEFVLLLQGIYWVMKRNERNVTFNYSMMKECFITG